MSEQPTPVEAGSSPAVAEPRATTGLSPKDAAGADWPPQGRLAAAVVAAATGLLALGVFSVMAQWLNPETYRPPFAVAGGRKMIFMWSNWAEMIGLLVPVIVVWTLTWVMLYDIWHDKPEFGRRSLIYSIVAILLGLIGSFPPFYTFLFPG